MCHFISASCSYHILLVCCLWAQIPPFYTDTSHVGLEAYSTPVWLHLNWLAYSVILFSNSHILRYWGSRHQYMNLEGCYSTHPTDAFQTLLEHIFLKDSALYLIILLSQPSTSKVTPLACSQVILLLGSYTWLKLDYFAFAKSLQSCPTLCDPRDGSPPGSPVPGILQARTLEWIAISFSTAWK